MVNDDDWSESRSDGVAISASLLGSLLVAAGRPTGSAGAVATAAAHWTTAETDESWSHRLARACRGLGLQVEEQWLSCEEASRLSGNGCALATWHDVHGWSLLLEARKDRVRLRTASPDTTRWLSTVELEELLGAQAGPLLWVVVAGGLSGAESSASERLPPVQRLVEIVRPDRGDLLAIGLYAVFIGLLTLAIPIAVQQLVNSVAFGGLVQPVVVLALLLFAGLALAAFLLGFQAYLAEIVQRRVFVRACVDLAHRLPLVSSEELAGAHGPELVNRFFDLVTLQKTGARLLLEGSSVALQTIAGLLILSLYHPLMLGLSVLLMSSMAFVTLVLGRGGTRTAIGESGAKYALAAWMEELARHPTAFRGRTGSWYASARADALASGWVEARRRHYRIVLRQYGAALGLQVVVNSLVLALGGFLVVAGELTLGQLVASEIIVATVVGAFARLGKQFEGFYDLLAAVDKIGVLLDLPLERADGEIPGAERGPAQVEVVGLSATGPGAAALRDVSLRLEPGHRTVLAGADHGARSILIEALCGRLRPSSGYVTLDGNDLRDLRLETIHEQTMSLREPEIFSGSILDNVRIGRVGASVDEVCSALARVGLLEAVRELPEGLRTPLVTHGAPLDRSQTARLMIARALLHQPRLLAVDGILDGLEAESRKLALDVLFDPEAPWTLLITSSSPDVIARAQRVLVLEASRVQDATPGSSRPSPRLTEPDDDPVS